MGAKRSLEFHPCGIRHTWLPAVTSSLLAGGSGCVAEDPLPSPSSEEGQCPELASGGGEGLCGAQEAPVPKCWGVSHRGV